MKKFLIAGLVQIFILINSNMLFGFELDIQEKVFLEDAISERIEKVASKILGDNVMAIVDVENSDNKSITLVVNDKIDESRINSLNNNILGLANINTSGGDKFEIKKVPFSLTKLETPYQINKIIVSQLPYYTGIFLMGIFLFGPMRRILRKFDSTLDLIKVQLDNRLVSRPNIALRRRTDKNVEGIKAFRTEAMPFLPPVRNENKTVSRNSGHFNFVNDSNISNLIRVLKKENPETIGLVLTFLQKEYANIVISSLPEELKIMTIKQMAYPKQFEIEQILQIEKNIKEKIDYLIGGPKNIVDLIEVYNKSEREEVISEVEKYDKKVAFQIKDILITVDDLMALSKDQLYAVYRNTGSRIFAAAIKNGNEELKNYVMNNLNGSVCEMLKQEIDSIPKDIPISRINKAKKELISALRRLENLPT